MTDIDVAKGDVVLSTMGRGFYVMDNPRALREWTPAVAAADVHVFKARTAYRGGPGSGFMGGGASTPDAPEWTPSGAQSDYFLGKDAQSATLEILDAAGKVVRTYSSAAAAAAPAGRSRRGGGAAPALAKARGMHRFTWDLGVTVEGAGRSMPRAVPGTYQVRLTVDGKSATQPLELKIDPRLAADGLTVADLQAQYDLALRILAAVADCGATITKVDGAIQRAAQGSDVRKQLEEIQRALVTDPNENSYPKPMLADQFQYLYSNMSGTEQKPSGEMTKRLETLKAELEQHKARLEQVLRTITE
ncbi:MAG: hypothetical protein FIA95_01185 [Gemmatimonadetes bacterium]|nr:hypothetical protein [Gemmatimonadota bacterium]